MRKLFALLILLYTSPLLAIDHVITYTTSSITALKTGTTVPINVYRSGTFDSSQIPGPKDEDADWSLALSTGDFNFWKRTGNGVWDVMTPQEQTIILNYYQSISTQAAHNQALLQILANDPLGLALKGYALVNLDGYNNHVNANNCHVQFEVNMGTTVAAATSLANLQARWATLTPCPTLNTINKSQLLNQTNSKISGGGAD